MPSNGGNKFDAKAFLHTIGEGITSVDWRKDETVFAQGEPADALFYMQSGTVKITTVSAHGKEAVVAILGTGDFFGEGCMAGQPLRISSAIALVNSTILRLDKAAVVRVLHTQAAFSELFMAYLLARNIRIEADLIDQLFNSSENVWRDCFCCLRISARRAARSR
jgi:CRP/FNR family cyclic AMP-dependent transcriptional regulator